MQIEIDFDVFKALTAMRKSESDSYNSVIRRILKLPDQERRGALPLGEEGAVNALAALSPARPPSRNALLDLAAGAWFGNTHFPEGTQFRATYKGQTYFANIQSGRWVGQDGAVRTSPSDAASAISGTNVNGWRFWHAKRPQDSDWTRMDEFKR